MKFSTCLVAAVLFLTTVVSLAAQTSNAVPQTIAAAVPRLIRFSATARDEAGSVRTGLLGMTFALYKEEQGGAPLWLETQTVRADSAGHYTVMLGSSKPEGLAVELFTTGEAQWLGVRVEGQPEQARVLLVSVPYAIKAHEAETLAGRSISDFVLQSGDKAAPFSGTVASGRHSAPNASSATTPPPPAGPTNFTGSNTTQIVGVTQSGTGTGLSATATTHAAVAGTISGPTNTAVYGLASNTTAGSNAAGVTGQSNTQSGPGVQGVTTTSGGIGVQGVATAASGGLAVQGLNKATSGAAYGVSGLAASTGAGSAAVIGTESGKSGIVFGVQGQTNSTTANAAGVNGFEGAATGAVFGVAGSTSSTGSGAAGVSGFASAKTGKVFGVVGSTNSTTNFSAAVSGFEGAATGQVVGVAGATNSATNLATGVAGFEGAATGQVFGVSGGTNSATNGAAGVSGFTNATTGQIAGVSGSTASVSGSGVVGFASASATGAAGVGVTGTTAGPNGSGVVGNATATSGPAIGVFGQATSPGGAGAAFTNLAGGKSLVIIGNGAGFAQIFNVDASGNGFYAGNLNVKGTLTKGGGSFKIDHPLDPANKYLSHSFVESPDMMNVYNGNVITDKHGLATVVLPDYFEALNQDFRYQLTVIDGKFAQAIVAQKISHNSFVIRTSKPRVEVSWQVTGIRHDAYANAYRIPVEEEKAQLEQGRYLHPELFGASSDQAIGAAAAVPMNETVSAAAGSR